MSTNISQINISDNSDYLDYVRNIIIFIIFIKQFNYKFKNNERITLEPNAIK